MRENHFFFEAEKYKGNILDLMSIFSTYDRSSEKSSNLPDKLNVEIIDDYWKRLLSLLDLKLDNNDIADFFERSNEVECNNTICSDCRICDSYQHKVTFRKNSIAVEKENIERIIGFLLDREDNRARYQMPTHRLPKPSSLLIPESCT